MHSINKTARIAGSLYLLLAIIGPFSMLYVPSQLVAPGDPATTASQIIASGGLFRAGMLGDVAIVLIEIVLSALLYALLKPVSKTLSLAAAFARLTMTAIQAFNLLNHFIVLLLLGGAGSLKAFGPDQARSLALLFLDAHGAGVLIWQACFGLHCLLLGFLVYKAGYFPSILGVLLVLAGLGYLTDSLGNLLFPAYESIFGLIVAVPAFVGEVSFTLWLLLKGVRPAAARSLTAAEYPQA